MKLLDFFAAYVLCRKCTYTAHPPCKVLCEYPEEARFAATKELIMCNTDSGMRANSCSIHRTEKGYQVHKQLMGDYS